MLKEIFAIGSYPGLSLNTERSALTKALTVLKVYGCIILYLLAIGPITYLADYCVTHLFHHPSISHAGFESIRKMIKKIGYTPAVIYICIIGPILEETIFRLPLSFKRVHIAIGIAVGILLLTSPIPFVKNLSHDVGLGYALAIRIAVSALICFIVVMLLPAGFEIATRYKKPIIIISIVLFGLMHIFNYVPLQWQLIWLYPIYVLPQLGMGVALTYVRFKNGFIWGIALHCLINSVSMGLSSVATKAAKQLQHQAVGKKDTKQARYTLPIKIPLFH